MSSLTQPMPYYPTTSSPITRAQPATTASRGSFVPVFTVLGVHDMDDGFEIKFAPGKPAAWKNDSKPDGRGRQQHQHPQVGVAMPREYAGFRYPAAPNGAVRQGQVRGGTFVSAKP